MSKMIKRNFVSRATHLLGTAVRETGQAMDRLGLKIVGNDIYQETYSRHRPVMNIYDKVPGVAVDAFVAPSASVIGKVLMLDKSSVWYGAVVRGDKNKIKLGFCSNIQDRAVVTCTSELESGFPADVDIGNYVTVGSGAVLTSCIIQDETSIGMNAIVQEGSVIEKNVVVAPGSVVAPGTLIPSGQLWAGNPAQFVRNLTEDEKKNLELVADNYAILAAEHKDEFLPYGTLYQHAEAKGEIA